MIVTILYRIKCFITDTRRSNAMKKCAAFIHTGSLEVYHNVRLKYLPKHTSYTLKRMIIMAMLVCIEVNVNLEKTGKPKVYSQYSKVRAAWVEKPRNSGKVYIFRHDVIKDMMSVHNTNEKIRDIDLQLKEMGYITRTVPKNIAPIDKLAVTNVSNSSTYTRF